MHNLQMQQQQLTNSARNLAHHQSFQHIGPSGGVGKGGGSGSQQDLSHNNGQQQRGVAPGPRQRPASMYDTPSMGYGGMVGGPVANGGGPKKPNGTAPTGRSGTLRRNSADLVSSMGGTNTNKIVSFYAKKIL